MSRQVTEYPPDSTKHLVCEKRSASNDRGMLCFALAHNEAQILPQFLKHYRSIGVTNFIFVDDHSTDQTYKILAAQDDVSVYKPKAGSSYKTDKVSWRCDLLDIIADQRWVLLPDTDEHLIYPDMDNVDINDFARKIEAEGAQALFVIMVDMYADKPLKDHRFEKGNLIEAFPYFDMPSDSAAGYRLMPPATRFLKNFPTPPICAYGGVRDRMFFGQTNVKSHVNNWLLRNFAHINRPLNPGFIQRIANSIMRTATKKRFGPMPLSMTKLGLVKWQKGMKLPGGPHAVSQELKLAEATGAFLHFKFTNGIDGIEYIVERGQHVGESEMYRKLLSQIELFDQSPFCKLSKRFTGADSFIDCGLIRTGNNDRY